MSSRNGRRARHRARPTDQGGTDPRPTATTSGQRATSHHHVWTSPSPQERRQRVHDRPVRTTSSEDEQAADDEHHRPSESPRRLRTGRATRRSPWIWSSARPASVKTFDARRAASGAPIAPRSRRWSAVEERAVSTMPRSAAETEDDAPAVARRALRVGGRAASPKRRIAVARIRQDRDEREQPVEGQGRGALGHPVVEEAPAGRARPSCAAPGGRAGLQEARWAGSELNGWMVPGGGAASGRRGDVTRRAPARSARRDGPGRARRSPPSPAGARPAAAA